MGNLLWLILLILGLYGYCVQWHNIMQYVNMQRIKRKIFNDKKTKQQHSFQVFLCYFACFFFSLNCNSLILQQKVLSYLTTESTELHQHVYSHLSLMRFLFVSKKRCQIMQWHRKLNCTHCSGHRLQFSLLCHSIVWHLLGDKHQNLMWLQHPTAELGGLLLLQKCCMTLIYELRGSAPLGSVGKLAKGLQPLTQFCHWPGRLMGYLGEQEATAKPIPSAPLCPGSCAPLLHHFAPFCSISPSLFFSILMHPLLYTSLFESSAAATLLIITIRLWDAKSSTRVEKK